MDADLFSSPKNPPLPPQPSSLNPSSTLEPLETGVQREQIIANRLISDWVAKLTLMGGTEHSTAHHYQQILNRLLTFASKFPWQLTRKDVDEFFKMIYQNRDRYLSELTIANYSAAWRSFQSYMLRSDISGEINRLTGIIPQIFIDEENGISVKRAKCNTAPKGWALTPELILQADKEFICMIKMAKKSHSKSYYTLLRDRVMFHLCIHFALRVSELVTLTLKQFQPHPDPIMRQKFGSYGMLTVTGKNKVTGTIPMREETIFNLLSIYLDKIRPRLLLCRDNTDNSQGLTTYQNKTYAVADLLFFSERGTVLNPQNFRNRLQDLSRRIMTPQRIVPHTLRHTGCTLMVPLYTIGISRLYMRHRHLHTTLSYYHPNPLDSGLCKNGDYSVTGWFEKEDY